jgi:Ca2+-binding RTX toxin-like protein
MLLTATTVAVLVMAGGVALAADVDCAASTALGQECFGGDGDDTLNGGPAEDAMYAQDGTDTLYGLGDNDYLDGGPGNDTLFAAEGNDGLNGCLCSGGVSDTDTLYGGDGHDGYQFSANWGVDTIPSDPSGSDDLSFLPGAIPKRLTAPLTVNLAEGLAVSGANEVRFPPTTAVDPISGQAIGGIESAEGGLADDTILGSDADNGLGGDPRDYEGGGNDNLAAFGGDDYLEGGPGNDTLDGGAGDDTYIFHDGWGADTISADASGLDFLEFFSFRGQPAFPPLTIDLAEGRASSGPNSLTFDPTIVIEGVRGGESGDTIIGNDAENILFGNEGDDVIYAIDGHMDQIYCGDGDDTSYVDDTYTTGTYDNAYGGDCEVIWTAFDIYYNTGHAQEGVTAPASGGPEDGPVRQASDDGDGVGAALPTPEATAKTDEAIASAS